MFYTVQASNPSVPLAGGQSYTQISSLADVLDLEFWGQPSSLEDNGEVMQGLMLVSKRNH